MSNAERKRARLERELSLLAGQASAQVVERKVGVDESRQIRFDNAPSVFSSIFRWVSLAITSEPSETQSVSARDAWLRAFVRQEPLLSGVLNSVVDIDKNRGWTIEGGRNQVKKYSDILHQADDGAGWREFCSWQAQAYYTTKMGFVVELGREGEEGPLRALWSVDPAKCVLTGNPEFPLRYTGQGSTREWARSAFFRGASLPSTDETHLGYGFPAAERCLSLAKIMIGVLSHFKQQVLTEVPEGILTGKNISQTQWDSALEHYGEALQGYSERFARLMSLMSEGDAAPEVAITWFRHLPEGFKLDEWISILMYGYALAFGYDPREFWPVSMGQLGTAKESDVQHRKATSKGDLDFSLGFQERIQGVFPESLSFEFQSRDIEGEIAETNAKIAKANFIETMAGLQSGGQNVLSREQIIQLAIEEEIIPEDYAMAEEPTKETDTDENLKKDEADMQLGNKQSELEKAAVNPALQEAAKRFPDEPLVRYDSRTNRMITLFAPGQLTRHSYPVAKARSIDNVMITLKVNEDTSKQLLDAVKQSVPALITKPLGELHITLAMPHQSSDVTQETLVALLSVFARNHPPLKGTIGGIAKFNENDNQIPLVALFDCPELPQFQIDIVNLLEQAGVSINKTHGFIPHITLAYLDADSPNINIALEPQPLAFNNVALAWQDEWKEIPLGETERSLRDFTQEYRSTLIGLAKDVHAKKIKPKEMAIEHKRLIRETGRAIYEEGLRLVGIDELDEFDEMQIRDWIAGQLPFVTDFAHTEFSGQPEIYQRVRQWTDALEVLGRLAKASADQNVMGTWKYGETDHCDDCRGLNGQRHRVKWFISRKLLPREPGSETLRCGGWLCKCGVFSDDGKRIL